MRVNNQQSSHESTISSQRPTCPHSWSTVNQPNINELLTSRKYWMIYSGPGFLVVVCLAPPPLPPPFSLVSKLDQGHTGRREIETTCWRKIGERDRMRGRSHILALYKPLNILFFYTIPDISTVLAAVERGCIHPREGPHHGALQPLLQFLHHITKKCDTATRACSECTVEILCGYAISAKLTEFLLTFQKHHEIVLYNFVKI